MDVQSQDSASRQDPAREPRVRRHRAAAGRDTQDPPAGASSGASGGTVSVEAAEAALVEHYPRLVALAHLVLPQGNDPGRRVRTAHALAQRALPRRAAESAPGVPGPRSGTELTPEYAALRLRVLSAALEAGGTAGRLGRLRQSTRLLPQVWGLRLFPRSGGAAELALEQELAQLNGPARAAFALLHREELTGEQVLDLLDAAGAPEPEAALRAAERLRVPGVRDAGALLTSPGFDPCALQARPTDLLRRRQHGKAVLAGAAALLACLALLGMPGDSWGPEGAAAPPYARNPASEAALDPARLVRVPSGAWRTASRRDFGVWPARGSHTSDRALLRRALAVWARPGSDVQVSATSGTPSGGPPGPAHLLYAGEIDQVRVVLLYDGMRIVRYAEPVQGTAGAALDFASVAGAEEAEASAVVVGRADSNVRYLTAPWTTGASVRDLLHPDREPEELVREKDGVTRPMQGPAAARDCTDWHALQLQQGSGEPQLLTDLGELAPARLTFGPPREAGTVDDAAAREAWAAGACAALPPLRSSGVRSVNAWEFAEQNLPDGAGGATWTCARAETWLGTRGRAAALFRAPGTEHATVAANAADTPACGPRQPQALAGVLWKSPEGNWYLLGAGSEQVTSLRARGQVTGEAAGRTLALPAQQGERARLSARTEDGETLLPLR